MKYQFECTYCGNKWIKDLFSRAVIDSQICPTCKDQNLKIKDLTNKVDYYRDSTAFVSEEDEPETNIDPDYWGIVD